MGGFWKLGFMFNTDDGAAKIVEPASIDSENSKNKQEPSRSVSDRLPIHVNADGLANTSNVITNKRLTYHDAQSRMEPEPRLVEDGLENESSQGTLATVPSVPPIKTGGLLLQRQGSGTGSPTESPIQRRLLQSIRA